MVGRMISIMLIVGAVWVGAEVYSEGLNGAFGGIFASTFDAPAHRPTHERAVDAFQRWHNKSEERVERMLDE